MRRAAPLWVWQNFSEGRVQALRLEADDSRGVLHTLSGIDARDPQVAVDPRGSATVVWRRADPAARGDDSRIESLRIAADGTAGVVHTLSGADARDPKVAVDPQGRATVVWRLIGGRRRIESVRLAADSTPGPVRNISKTKGFDPQVAVDPRGRSTVVWATGRPGRIKSRRLAANGTAGAIKTLSKTRATDPQVAVESKGRATVVWELDCASCVSVVDVQALRLGVDGAPGAVHRLTKRPEASDPQVAVDSKGRPTVVWWREEEGGVLATRGRNRG